MSIPPIQVGGAYPAGNPFSPIGQNRPILDTPLPSPRKALQEAIQKPGDQRYIAFWLNLLEELPLDDDVKSKIGSDLIDCQANLGQQQDGPKLHRAIVQALNEGREFCLPLQVCTPTKTTLLLRFSKDPVGVVRCRVMDRSLGHLKKFEGMAPKLAYRLPDIMINPEVFEGPTGESLIARLASMDRPADPDAAFPDFLKKSRAEARLKKGIVLSSYSKEGVIKMLWSVGRFDKQDPILNEITHGEDIVGQRHAERSDFEQSLKLLIRDRMIAGGYSKSNIDSIYWKARFSWLVNSDQVSSADARSFAATTTKLYEYGALTEQEAQQCTAFLESAAANRRERRDRSVTLQTLVPSASRPARVSPEALQAPKIGHARRPDAEPIAPCSERPLITPPQTHEQLLTLLSTISEHCIQRIEAKDYREATLAVNEVLRNLPPAKHEFWNGVHIEEISATAAKLRGLVALGLESANAVEGNSHFTALFICEGFALTMCLLRRVPEMYLRDIAVINPLTGVNHGLSWQGEDAARLQAVAEYFDELPKDQPIFSLDGYFERQNPKQKGLVNWSPSLIRGDYREAQAFKTTFDYLAKMRNESRAASDEEFLVKAINDPQTTTEVGFQTLFYFNLLSHYRWDSALSQITVTWEKSEKSSRLRFDLVGRDRKVKDDRLFF